MLKNQVKLPISGSVSFNLPSVKLRMQLLRIFDQVATPEPNSSNFEKMQKSISRLTSSTQTSFMFRVDILKTLIIKVKQQESSRYRIIIKKHWISRPVRNFYSIYYYLGCSFGSENLT